MTLSNIHWVTATAAVLEIEENLHKLLRIINHKVFNPQKK
jgi:hypothetical protein